MKEYSLIMGLADYISVIFFAIAGIVMTKAMYGRCRSGQFAAMAGGFLFIFFAGFLKATYKTLYGAGICDYPVLSEPQMMLTAIGLCMLGGSAICIGGKNNRHLAVYAAAPPLIATNLPFILLTTVGSLSVFIGFTRIALRIKAKPAIAFSAVYFILGLAMGGMGSKADFSESGINWIAQGLQYLSNAGLMISTIIIAKKIKSVPAFSEQN